MKRLVILGLAALLIAPSTDARKKQAKAGKITDNVYHDDKYGFELSLLEDWKSKVGKKKENVRLRLTERKPQIPNDYKDAPDNTAIPQLVVYVDTSTFGVHVFIDSLTSDAYKSKQKKEILTEFEFLNEPEVIPKRRSRLDIAGMSGLIWRGEAKYERQVSTSMTGTSGKLVRRSYGGAIAAVKIDDENIVLFFVRTEWEYFEPIMQEVMAVIQSFNLPGEEDDEG
jgi:hypothetical protein